METETEQGKMLFHIRNSLVLNKGLMYVNTNPKGETEGVLAFIVPVAQCHQHLMEYIAMPAIRASNGPWLLLKRGSGGP